MNLIKLRDPIRHIRWQGDRLRVLDQRALPLRQRYVTCRSASEVARATRDMVLRGAPLIGVAAAYGMALAARKGARALPSAAATLKRARPTAVNLAHAVDHMLAVAAGCRNGELSRLMDAAARAYHQADIDANLAMAKLGAPLLPKGARVITHCNAGALATGGLGTAVGVIRYAHRLGRMSHVFPCETRPYLQGSRLTLWELMRAGIPSTLITDNMAAHLMKTARIDAVIVGSDRIAANGDVCNKIGTYGLAILARHHGIPFYAVAPTSTVDLAIRDGGGIPIEERSADEVLRIGGRLIAPRRARARHFAFDVTPAALVTAIVTERGVARPPYGPALRRIMRN